MITRRISSVAIALLASIAGLGLLWAGGITVYRSTSQFAGITPIVVGAALMAILGGLLLFVASASVMLSSLGVIVVGAAHVIGSMLTILVPFKFGGSGVSTPSLAVLLGLGSLNRDFTDGGLTFTATGLGLLLGWAMLGVGIGSSLRSRRPSLSPERRTVARVVAGLAGAVVGTGLVLGAVVIGADVYRNIFILARSAILSALPLVIVALLVGVILVSARWTSTAAIALGAVTTLLGLITAVLPISFYRSLPPQFVFGLASVSSTWFLFATGLGILGLGVGAAVRARRGQGALVVTEPVPPAAASV